MGLKTASFSQCCQLIVATRPNGGRWLTRTWDIDHVLDVRDWQLLHNPPDGAGEALTAMTFIAGGNRDGGPLAPPDPARRSHVGGRRRLGTEGIQLAHPGVHEKFLDAVAELLEFLI
jgi:hypothetical protein